MSKQLDLAHAQFVGYYAGKWGFLIGMIISMNLSKKEWQKMITDYDVHLDPNDIKEIEEYYESIDQMKN